MRKMDRSLPQWSLAAILLAMAVCAVAVGILSGSETHYTIFFHCQVMPATDDALVDWLERQDGVTNVRVSRVAGSIQIDFFRRRGTFDLPTPPLVQLGYANLVRMSTTISKPSMIVAAIQWLGRLPLITWLVVAAALGVLLIRKIKRSEKGHDRSNKGPAEGEKDI